MTVTTPSRSRAIDSVLVVGAGAMGAQIAMVCALAGLDVSLYDLEDDRLKQADEMLRQRVGRMVEKAKINATTHDAAFERLTFTADLRDAAAKADLVIEAIVEKLDAKRSLFGELDRLCPPHTILTSNSSSFVPSSMASATERPDRFCNMHFFNPALVMSCVEVVRGQATSDDTMTTVVDLTSRLGKEPVVLSKEINGFVANRILNAIRDESIYLLENGYASIESIDIACRSALGHPMGPFELQDLTGLDVGYYIKQGRYDESNDEKDKPSASLTARVHAGHLGRKTGRGWYRYDRDGHKLAPT